MITPKKATSRLIKERGEGHMLTKIQRVEALREEKPWESEKKQYNAPTVSKRGRRKNILLKSLP